MKAAHSQVYLIFQVTNQNAYEFAILKESGFKIERDLPYLAVDPSEVDVLFEGL